MKILLVEDDAALRGALEELLCREGYDVIKASNVSSARSAMNSEVDLIMLDVGLPEYSGRREQAVRVVRATVPFCGSHPFRRSEPPV